MNLPPAPGSSALSLSPLAAITTVQAAPEGFSQTLDLALASSGEPGPMPPFSLRTLPDATMASATAIPAVPGNPASPQEDAFFAAIAKPMVPVPDESGQKPTGLADASRLPATVATPCRQADAQPLPTAEISPEQPQRGDPKQAVPDAGTAPVKLPSPPPISETASPAHLGRMRTILAAQTVSGPETMPAKEIRTDNHESDEPTAAAPTAPLGGYDIASPYVVPVASLTAAPSTTTEAPQPDIAKSALPVIEAEQTSLQAPLGDVQPSTQLLATAPDANAAEHVLPMLAMRQGIPAPTSGKLDSRTDDPASSMLAPASANVRSSQGHSPKKTQANQPTPSLAVEAELASGPKAVPGETGSAQSEIASRTPAALQRPATPVFAPAPDQVNGPTLSGQVPVQSFGAGASIAPAPIPEAVTASHAVAQTPSSDTFLATAQPGQIGRDVGVAIAHRVSAGGEEVIVRLDPAELGRIEVRMSFDKHGDLRAVIAADSPVALDMLRRDSADLSRALNDAGVRNGGQSLHFQSEGGNSGNHQRSPWLTADPRKTHSMSDTDVETTPFQSVRTSGRYDLIA